MAIYTLPRNFIPCEILHIAFNILLNIDLINPFIFCIPLWGFVSYIQVATYNWNITYILDAIFLKYSVFNICQKNLVL